MQLYKFFYAFNYINNNKNIAVEFTYDYVDHMLMITYSLFSCFIQVEYANFAKYFSVKFYKCAFKSYVCLFDVK